MKAEIFPYLAIGLAKFFEKQDRRYPYPDSLQYSLNNIALALSSKYPKTMKGLILLFEKPLNEWWSDELPNNFDPNMPLLEDGELSFELIAYLDKLSEQENGYFHDSLLQIELILDNQKFKHLLDHLREKSITDMSSAHSDYVILRRFIIEHPFALQREISQVFSQTNYLNVAQVQDLYVKTSQITDSLRYSNSDGDPKYWLCERCGPLRVKNGRLESIKSSLCEKNCPRNQNGWNAIQPSNQLGVLRKGIHLRVYMPGVPELSLFNWLDEYQRKNQKWIEGIILWPGVDSYDLQVKFIDSVWAVDIKDHQNPYRLGEGLTRIYREGNVHWDQGYYVYPDYREKQRPDYGEVVRQASKTKGIHIVSEEVFKQKVISKLKSLKKGGS